MVAPGGEKVQTDPPREFFVRKNLSGGGLVKIERTGLQHDVAPARSARDWTSPRPWRFRGSTFELWKTLSEVASSKAHISHAAVFRVGSRFGQAAHDLAEGSVRGVTAATGVSAAGFRFSSGGGARVSLLGRAACCRRTSQICRADLPARLGGVEFSMRNITASICRTRTAQAGRATPPTRRGGVEQISVSVAGPVFWAGAATGVSAYRI